MFLLVNPECLFQNIMGDIETPKQINTIITEVKNPCSCPSVTAHDKEHSQPKGGSTRRPITLTLQNPDVRIRIDMMFEGCHQEFNIEVIKQWLEELEKLIGGHMAKKRHEGAVLPTTQ